MTGSQGGLESRAVGGVLLLVLCVLAFGLGGAALIDPDEGRNAVIAREMADGGQVLLPHLNGLPFLDKPFLHFSLAAAAIRLLGPTELAARLPSLLATWGSILLTYLLARRVAGAAVAPAAALALATTPLVAAMARVVIFDSTLAFFVLAAIAAFWRALAAEAAPGGRGEARWWGAAAWLAVALGLLTKGPIALLLALAATLPWAIGQGRARALFRLPGPLLFLGGTLAWGFAVEARHPGFLHYGLVTETWNRMTTDELDRSAPVWYFLPVVVGALFPWSWVAAAGVRGLLARTLPAERRAAAWFLLLWIGGPFLFFSLAQSKRPQYLLPLVPAVAILAAWALVEPATRARALRVGAAGWLAVAALTGAAAAWAASGRAPERLTRLDATAVLAGLALAAAAGGLAALRLRGRPALAPLALALPLLVVLPLLGPLHARVAEERSGRELARALAASAASGTAIVGVETYSPSAAFDLELPWIVSSVDGSALRSNSVTRFYDVLSAPPDSTLRPKSFWQEALAGCDRPYLFVIRPQYADERAAFERAGLPLVYESPRHVAFGPCRSPAPGGGS